MANPSKLQTIHDNLASALKQIEQLLQAKDSEIRSLNERLITQLEKVAALEKRGVTEDEVRNGLEDYVGPANEVYIVRFCGILRSKGLLLEDVPSVEYPQWNISGVVGKSSDSTPGEDVDKLAQQMLKDAISPEEREWIDAPANIPRMVVDSDKFLPRNNDPTAKQSEPWPRLMHDEDLIITNAHEIEDHAVRMLAGLHTASVSLMLEEFARWRKLFGIREV